MAFINFKTCCSDTKQLIRLVVLIICICVSCYQLAQCFRKIQHPPVSTHYGFYMNDSLRYPAITVCRQPPYKTELFEKFGFKESKEIEIGSTWNWFNFKDYTLEQFFDETTYRFDEIKKMAVLDRKMENIQVSSLYCLHYGKCYTLAPKKESINWGLEYGYFLLFSDMKRNGGDNDLSGYHFFIHDEMEKFTEKSQQADIFKEYIFVEAGDALQVNLKMNKYNQLPNRHNICNPQANYSKSRCMDDSANKLISEAVGCSTPWVPNLNLPPCNTSEQTIKMVEYSTASTYLSSFLEQTNCSPKCNATTYMPFLQTIRQISSKNCGLRIYFSSNLFTVMEEVLGYDWNSFLSDLGGSLGFLLGLSVLGMIGILEELFTIFTRIRGKEKGDQELNNKDQDAKKDGVVQTKNDFIGNKEKCIKTKNVNPEYKIDLEFYSKQNISKKGFDEKY